MESTPCPVGDCSGSIAWEGDLWAERSGDCSETDLHPHRWDAARGRWMFDYDRLGEAREAQPRHIEENNA